MQREWQIIVKDEIPAIQRFELRDDGLVYRHVFSRTPGILDQYEGGDELQEFLRRNPDLKVEQIHGAEALVLLRKAKIVHRGFGVYDFVKHGEVVRTVEGQEKAQRLAASVGLAWAPTGTTKGGEGAGEGDTG